MCAACCDDDCGSCAQAKVKPPDEFTPEGFEKTFCTCQHDPFGWRHGETACAMPGRARDDGYLVTLELGRARKIDHDALHHDWEYNVNWEKDNG